MERKKPGETGGKKMIIEGSVERARGFYTWTGTGKKILTFLRTRFFRIRHAVSQTYPQENEGKW
jgi:hypothetical protein